MGSRRYRKTSNILNEIAQSTRSKSECGEKDTDVAEEGDSQNP
jgi:hypothetical protein